MNREPTRHVKGKSHSRSPETAKYSEGCAENKASEKKNSNNGKRREAWPYLIHDLVIRADVCNLRCDYCGLGVEQVPPLHIMHGHVGLRDGAGRWLDVEPIEEVAHTAKQVVRSIQERQHFPQLKVSGGEISIVRKWMDLFFELAGSVEIIQLLTNGTGIKPEVIIRMTEHENVVVQISLDGTSAVANRFRGLGEAAVRRILKGIARSVAAGIDVEVNVVLHEASLPVFSTFVKWAAETTQGKPGNLILLPRPVRGPIADKIRGDVAQIEAFVQDLNKACNSVLPPIPYLRRLCEMLVSGRRHWPCYVPYFVLGTNERGKIAVCTCGGHLGTAGIAMAENDILEAGSFFPPERACHACKDCMTQYEMLNLFFERELSAVECAALPFFRKAETRLDYLAYVLKKRLETDVSVTLHP